MKKQLKVRRSDRALLAFGSALALASAAPAFGQTAPYTSLIVFGDSLSDPGNLAAFGAAPPPPYFEGQFSNGPVWALLFPGLTGVPQGPNFAFGGATSGPNGDPFQDLTNLQQQVDTYLASGAQAGAHDLFSIWIGANDYFAVAAALQDPDADLFTLASQAVALTIENISTSVVQLGEGAGAQQFALFNLPDLGATPLLNGSPETLAGGAQISALHNSALAGAAADLIDTYGYDITVIDMQTLFTDTVRNPSKYGITNTTDACLTPTSLCSTDLDTQNGFLFWDSVHPTALGQAITAAFAVDTLTAPRTLASQSEMGMAAGEAVLRQMASAAAVAGGLEVGQARGFAEINYGDASRDASFSTNGYDVESYSISLGRVGRVGDDAIAGGLVRYGEDSVDLESNRGAFDLSSISVGGFIHQGFGALQGRVSGGASVLYYNDIDRNTGVAGQVAGGSTSAFAASLQGEGRYVIGGESLSIAPLGRVTGLFVDINSYIESGAVGLDQRVDDRLVDSITAELGAAFDLNTEPAGISLEAVWVEAIDDEEHDIATSLVTIPDVIRTVDAEGRDLSYIRLTGSAQFDLGGLWLQLGGQADLERDDGDAWNAFARVGTAF